MMLKDEDNGLNYKFFILITRSFKFSMYSHIFSIGHGHDLENASSGANLRGYTIRSISRSSRNSFANKRNDCFAIGIPAGGDGGSDVCRGDRGGLRERSIAISSDAQSNERGRKIVRTRVRVGACVSNLFSRHFSQFLSLSHSFSLFSPKYLTTRKRGTRWREDECRPGAVVVSRASSRSGWITWPL